MATSDEIKLRMWNMALGHLSIRPCTSLTETSVAQAACSRFWDSTIEECLKSNKWPFNTPVVELTEIDTDDYDPEPAGFEYVYEYPSTALAIWTVYNSSTVNRDIGEEFRVVLDSTYSTNTGRKVIITNVDEAYAEYARLITNYTLLDSDFIAAAALKLASYLAIPLTNEGSERAEKLNMLFTAKISETQRLSSVENRHNANNDENNPYVDARA